MKKIFWTIVEESLTKYPTLFKFLNSNNESECTSMLPELEEKYLILTHSRRLDTIEKAAYELSIIYIVILLGKKIPLQTLLKSNNEQITKNFNELFKWSLANGHVDTLIALNKYAIQSHIKPKYDISIPLVNEDLAIIYELLEYNVNFYDLSIQTNTRILDLAAHYNDEKIIHKFFSQSYMFNKVLEDTNKYNKYIYSFINSQLIDLEIKKIAFFEKSGTGVFDIPKEEIRLWFFILKNIIYQNKPELNKHLLTILNIPVIKNNAHLESNELLRCARFYCNKQAACILLPIPKVLALAKKSNFYLEKKMEGYLDLKSLSENKKLTPNNFFGASQLKISDTNENREPLLREFNHY